MYIHLYAKIHKCILLCGIYTLAPYYMHLCILAYKCMYIAYTHPFITTIIFYKLTPQDILFVI